MIPNNSEEQRLEALTKEVIELRALRVFADKKIRALTVFASHQDEAVHLLAGKFQSYHQGRTDMDTLARGVNDIVEKATQAVNTLSAEFPSLEEFVSQHDDPSDLSTSARLAEWIDHIQKTHEENLRRNNEL